MSVIGNFYFGRLNLITDYEDKQEFILSTLKAKQSVAYKGFKYVFTKITSFEEEKENYVAGFLYKYTDADEHATFNENDWDESDTAVENQIVGRSSFLIEVKSGYIAYNEVKDQITNRSFRERFAELFIKSSHKALISVEIDTIGTRDDFLQEVRSFEQITRVSLTIRPSNPHSDKIWRNLDDMMRENGIDSFHEQYEAKKPGRSINIDSNSIEAKITMAEDGYGKAAVEGYKEGRRAVVRSGKNQITVPTENPSLLGGLIGQLKTTFKKLNTRIKK